MGAPRRGFIYALVGVIAFVVITVAAINIFGNALGEPCGDSYSCEGFLIGGAECLEEEDGRYCSRYCDRDEECPADWSCKSATPTALGIETTVTDKICVRPKR